MNKADQVRIQDAPGGATVAVKVVPGARGDRLAGVLGDRLKLAVSAPAEKGKANQAAARLLAAALGVSPRDVKLAAGATSPRKQLRISGLDAAAVRRRLERA